MEGGGRWYYPGIRVRKMKPMKTLRHDSQYCSRHPSFVVRGYVPRVLPLHQCDRQLTDIDEVVSKSSRTDSITK
jgi:hypothetical protein